MDKVAEVESSNINSLWLNNIYENLKNLEMLERLAKEGCSSIFDYFQISPENKRIMLADVQYKNLRFMITEMDLLLTDLTPVIEGKALTKFRSDITRIQCYINQRKLFVKESYSASRNQIISSYTTEFFRSTLDMICNMHIDIIKEIKEILYMGNKNKDSQKVSGGARLI